MQRIELIIHAPGAPGLRFLGLGPGLKPIRGLLKLKELLDHHSFWAKGRNTKNLKTLLSKSTAIVSLWAGSRMVGFGRATSDGIYRAVLWDIVVAEDLQGHGLGKKVVNALLSINSIKNAERIYLMTTKETAFYKQLGFREVNSQKLLMQGCIDLKEKSLSN